MLKCDYLALALATPPPCLLRQASSPLGALVRGPEGCARVFSVQPILTASDKAAGSQRFHPGDCMERDVGNRQLVMDWEPWVFMAFWQLRRTTVLVGLACSALGLLVSCRCCPCLEPPAVL